MGSLCSTIEEEAQQEAKMALTRDELATLLIFQRITDSWVREVHRFESMRKRKQNFVIFRDSNNRKLTSLAELKAEGVEVDESSFKTAVCNEIVSNKVGANKKARREVRAWTHEIMEERSQQSWKRSRRMKPPLLRLLQLRRLLQRKLLQRRLLQKSLPLKQPLLRLLLLLRLQLLLKTLLLKPLLLKLLLQKPLLPK